MLEKTIIASLTGIISEVDIDLIRQYLEEIELAQKHKQEAQEKLTQICEDEFPKEFENLQTISSVKERSATSILAEIGANMKMFITASALVSWCGLKPQNEKSAGKIKSRRITHGNKYIRKTMVECAWSTSKTQNCFFFRFSLYPNCCQKEKCHESKSGHCTQNVNNHLVCVIRGETVYRL